MFTFNQVKKYGAKVVAGVAAGATSLQVMAASQLPVGAFTTVTADALDTAKDISVQLLPTLVGILIAGAILTWSGKGLRKSGVK